jgi:hypothetical protein
MQEYLTSKQAAEFLGYSEHTLSMSRSSGKLGGVTPPEFIKAGKAVRYLTADLRGWLDQFGKRTETEKK